jgi:hypothetical protein
MQMPSIIRKLPHVVAALVVGSAVAVGAAPLRASAADLPGFICGPAPIGGQLTVCVKGVAVLVPNGASAVITASCTAVVEGAVESTMVGCQLNAIAGGGFGNAMNVLTPGPTSTTAIVPPVTRPLQPYQICVGGTYFNIDGSSGSTPGNWAFQGCFDVTV